METKVHIDWLKAEHQKTADSSLEHPALDKVVFPSCPICKFIKDLETPKSIEIGSKVKVTPKSDQGYAFSFREEVGIVKRISYPNIRSGMLYYIVELTKSGFKGIHSFYGPDLTLIEE